MEKFAIDCKKEGVLSFVKAHTSLIVGSNQAECVYGICVNSLRQIILLVRGITSPPQGGITTLMNSYSRDFC